VFALVIIGVTVLWRRTADSGDFIGHAEVVQVSVNCSDAGMLTNLLVTEFQEVAAGDPVAEVNTTDPRTAHTRLAVMRSKMHLLELEIEPILTRQRAALEYERLAVECARIRADLAIAKVNLENARTNFNRHEELRKKDILSGELYDLARNAKEALETEVEQKSNIVVATDKALERLNWMADSFTPSGENDPIRQAIQVEEERVRLFHEKMKPIQLSAPIDGVVTFIHRRAGEEILPGEAIVTITSQRAQRIVGYLPQGFSLSPKPGMLVKISTRGMKRKTALAKIQAISPHYQSLTNALVPPLMVRPSLVPPVGRTVSVSLPAELGLLPGEPVDLTIVDRMGAKILPSETDSRP
jgi:multidrug resistance efflux pump